MKGSLKLGSIKGIGVFIHWTFTLIILFILYKNYKAGHTAEQMLWSVVFVLSIFGTVFLHELGHALAALQFGVKTKDITILPIGGMARLEKIPEKPKEEFVVAIAGPAVNVILAVITGLFINFPAPEQLADILQGGVNASNFFIQFFVVNIWLAIFNLVPAFPMDGGRILRALLSIKLPRYLATKIAARVGQILAIGFIFVGINSNPFLIFIGIFIILGAQGEAEMVKTAHMLKDVLVRDLVMKDFARLDVKNTLSDALEILLNSQHKSFLVTSSSLPVGTLSRDELVQALASGSDKMLIKDAMNSDLIRIDAHEELEKAFTLMQSNGASLIAVFDKGQLLGVLDMENILEFIMVKSAKERHSSD